MRLSLALVVVLVCACGGSSGDSEPPPFTVRESVEQLHVTHAPPGVELEVVDASGARVAVGTTDALGSLMLRELPAGPGYRVRTTSVEPALEAGPFEVMSVAGSQPAQAFYDEQVLAAGYQYITTRDGTTLSAYITFPRPIEEGPFPTVVNYSGYDPSRPGGPIGDGSLSGLCAEIAAICDAPTDPSALIAAIFGYATVSVNLRGTGCSGGAFDYFETMQVLDGYDVIETVAAQDWVMHGEVGMVGLSYPGITQLWVASSQPPHLAAIAPMSVIGDSATTMLPGGILNDGFATSWIENVISKAAPYGQGWEQDMVDAGDTQCAENQLLHGQMVDNVAQAREITYYVPEEHDRYNPTSFADQIQVPILLASAWQDEQTGPYFFTLLDRLTGSPDVHVIVYNGVHIDAFQPEVVETWLDFLELHVARRVPVAHPTQTAISGVLFQSIFATGALTLDDSQYGDAASYEEALAAWQASPRVRALFESGAGDAPGVPEPTFELGFSAWPPVETTPLTLYGLADGTLSPAPPVEPFAASTFALDPGAGDRGILMPGANIWALLPRYDWRQPAPGSAVVFVSAPLAEDLVMLGTASVDLWIRSPVDDADLEINLSEVRPDGQEMYVQSGWIRASLSASGTGATATWPAPSFLEADAALLVPGEWREVRVGTAGFQHVFRAGSRLRVAIDTPGDSRAEWRFDTLPFPEGTSYDIGHDVSHPTRVVLPVLEGVQPGSPLPPCPSLRGQQCREFVPYTNVPAAP
jgi:predicted acyl esterase